jgi:dihydrofolate reductase
MSSLIVAADNNGVIGDSSANKLPWYLPDELKWFKKMTTGKVVVMGRKTYQSIGRPLSDRQNIVLTSNPALFLEDARNWDNVKFEGSIYLPSYLTDIFYIGGERVYRQAILSNRVDTAYVTHVDTKTGGDIRFPFELISHWKYDVVEEHQIDENHQYSYRICRYIRP